MIDEARLKEIEERAGKATPPPWSTKPSGKTFEGFSLDVLIAATAPGKFNRVFATPQGGRFPAADQDFIANARQDVPDLVAYCRQLRRTLDHLYSAACNDVALTPEQEQEIRQLLELDGQPDPAGGLKGGAK